MKSGADQIISMINAEGVKRQQLPDCILEAKYKKRDNFTEISFGTRVVDVAGAIDATDMVGIILWIPRDVYDKHTKVKLNG